MLLLALDRKVGLDLVVGAVGVWVARAQEATSALEAQVAVLGRVQSGLARGAAIVLGTIAGGAALTVGERVGEGWSKTLRHRMSMPTFHVLLCTQRSYRDLVGMHPDPLLCGPFAAATVSHACARWRYGVDISIPYVLRK